MTAVVVRRDLPVRKSTETKAAFKTTGFIAYVASVVAVVIVATLVEHTSDHADYFRADKPMFYVVLLTIAYLGSRGLAKAGNRDFYDDTTNNDRDHHRI